VDITLIKNHDAGYSFPNSMEEIEKYDVVILSDIGSDTLLLHPDTFLHSKPTPDRLKLITGDPRNSWIGIIMILYGLIWFNGYQNKFSEESINEKSARCYHRLLSLQQSSLRKL